MTIKIDLKPEIAAQLAAGAKARGMPLEKYAESLLRDATELHSEANGQLSIEELLHAMLNASRGGLGRAPRAAYDSIHSRELLRRPAPYTYLTATC